MRACFTVLLCLSVNEFLVSRVKGISCRLYYREMGNKGDNWKTANVSGQHRKSGASGNQLAIIYLIDSVEHLVMQPYMSRSRERLIM